MVSPNNLSKIRIKNNYNKNILTIITCLINILHYHFITDIMFFSRTKYPTTLTDNTTNKQHMINQNCSVLKKLNILRTNNINPSTPSFNKSAYFIANSFFIRHLLLYISNLCYKYITESGNSQQKRASFYTHPLSFAIFTACVRFSTPNLNKITDT